MKRMIIITVFLGILTPTIHADEGMWLPMLIKRLNIDDMQKKGLELSADEIYSVNKACLKDAIVSLGGFCTAEIVSGQGLMLTNHHCGYDIVRSHSTVENDILTNGFWALKKSEELPAEGVYARLLVRMEDVTGRVNEAIGNSTGVELDNKLNEISETIKSEATKDTDFDASVRSFFSGNAYYLFVYETYEDVRLVGAPPSSIGKFGGDTDNWMWPRHTGDFSVLRIYAGKDNKPAKYSKDNRPFKPKYFLPVSLNGYKPHDFTMIMGYPGSTDRYLSSYGVKLELEYKQPTTVQLREKRLAIMKEAMASSDAIRLKYASTYAQVSNYYKYFKGQMRGLKRLHVLEKKQTEEKAFRSWANANADRNKIYGNVIDDIAASYKGMENYHLARVYVNEALLAPKLGMASWITARFLPMMKAELTSDNPSLNPGYISFIMNQYDNYNLPLEKKIFAALLSMYNDGAPKDLVAPEFYATVKKYKGDFNAMAEAIYSKSIFSSPESFVAFSESPSLKKLQKDPAYKLYLAIYNHYYDNVRPKIDQANAKYKDAEKLYKAGLMKMNPDKKYYPDANSTMRLTYATVEDYYPADAVHYDYYTTLDGVMEKEDPSNPEFIVPEKLKTLWKNKDYGPYGVDGVMYVNFLTTNDITGGNSGSPVINGKGQLIGIAFDGNWEAMSGDIAYETKLQRTISVDIRYVLFIIEKYGGAANLIREMKLVKGVVPKKQSVQDIQKIPADKAAVPAIKKIPRTSGGTRQ